MTATLDPEKLSFLYGVGERLRLFPRAERLAVEIIANNDWLGALYLEAIAEMAKHASADKAALDRLLLDQEYATPLRLACVALLRAERCREQHVLSFGKSQ